MDCRDLTDDGYVHNHPLSITEHSLQTLHDPLRRLAVPQRRDRPFLPLSGHHACECERQLARIGPDEFICADCDRFRSVGVVAKDCDIQLPVFLWSAVSRSPHTDNLSVLVQ